MILLLRHQTRHAPWLAALVLSACASGAHGQAPTGLVSMPDLRASVQLQADSLYRAGEHEEALAILTNVLERSPENYTVQVLAARECIVLGYAAPDSDSARIWLARGIAHGQQAMALNPNGEDGRYAHLAAVGLLGLIESSPRERARLGVVVDNAARSLLEVNPEHAGAHNALGKLYFELAGLSWFSRIFARRWMGGDLLSRATWEAAEALLRRAVELQPERNYHSVDLGALLVERDRFDEARTVLGAALRVPLEVPEQEGYRRDARRMLEEIRRQTGSHE